MKPKNWTAAGTAASPRIRSNIIAASPKIKSGITAASPLIRRGNAAASPKKDVVRHQLVLK